MVFFKKLFGNIYQQCFDRLEDTPHWVTKVFPAVTCQKNDNWGRLVPILAIIILRAFQITMCTSLLLLQVVLVNFV